MKKTSCLMTVAMLVCLLFSGCGTGKIKELKADGIVITGNFSPAVSVEYSSMLSTNVDYPYIIETIDNNTNATAVIVKTIYLYDKEGNVVNPEAEVTVTIDIPEELKAAEGNSYAVYYDSPASGIFEQMKSSYTESTITFRISYLNTYEYSDYGDEFCNGFAIIKENGAGGVVSLDGESSANGTEDGDMEQYERVEYTDSGIDCLQCGMTKEDFDISKINHYTTGNGNAITDTNYASFIESGTYEDMRISGAGTGTTARNISIGATASEVISAYGDVYSLVADTTIDTFEAQFNGVDELVYGMILDTKDAVQIEFYFDKDQKLVAICYAFLYARNLN